jgi:hypothetical protein
MNAALWIVTHTKRGSSERDMVLGFAHYTCGLGNPYYAEERLELAVQEVEDMLANTKWKQSDDPYETPDMPAV